MWKDKHLSSRINKIYKLKIPAYIVIGNEEVENDSFVLKTWYNNLSSSLSKDDLVAKIKELNETT